MKGKKRFTRILFVVILNVVVFIVSSAVIYNSKFLASGNKELSIMYGMILAIGSNLLICFLVVMFPVVRKVCFDVKKKKLITGNKDTMKFMDQMYYLVHTRAEGDQVLSVEELYERVMNDSSKSNYHWIASAGELVRICKKTSFPIDYSIDIRIAILKCFASVEHSANCGGDKYKDKQSNIEAVQYCYNSLYGVDKEDAIDARKSYLSEKIKSVSYVYLFDYYSGATYRRLCKQWHDLNFEKYISQKEVDFANLLPYLHNDFVEMIKKAEENGDLEDDKRTSEERWRAFCREMMEAFEKEE